MKISYTWGPMNQSSVMVNSMANDMNGLFGDQELVRGEWVEACGFHQLTEGGVLGEVAKRVAAVKAKAGANKQSHPLVLLDLDSTLYEVGPRSHQIIMEWTQSAQSAPFPKVRETLLKLEEMHVGYSLRDTFHAIGLLLSEAETKKAWESAKKFWSERFFASEYLKYDRAYPGAAEFARELHALGAELVYLTGRDEPGMGAGTRQKLLSDGFPWETERTHLLMKEASHIDDLEHKKNAARYIREHGTLIASFENEPPNLVALYELFPEAMHVFVDTVCSDRPSKPAKGLYRIKGFSRDV